MRRAAVRRRPSSGWIDPAQLATRLATARTLPELLETRRRFAPEMDFSHAPVAWSRLARLRRRPAERAWLDENLPFLEPLAAHTAELVEQSEDIEAGRRAALASALVAAGVRSEPPWNELWDAIERRSVESAPLSECDECASVAEALVNAGHSSQRYLEAAAPVVARSLRREAGARRGGAILLVRGRPVVDEVRLECIAAFASALARGAAASEDRSALLGHLAAAAVPKVPAARASHLVSLACTYGSTPPPRAAAAGRDGAGGGGGSGSAGGGGGASAAESAAQQSLLRAIADELRVRPWQLKPAEVALLAEVYCTRLPSGSAGGGEGGAAALVPSRGVVAVDSAPLLESLARVALPRLDRYKAYNLARLAQAASRWPAAGGRGGSAAAEQLLSSVAAAAAAREGEFRGESRALLVDAYARARLLPPIQPEPAPPPLSTQPPRGRADRMII